ncbi:MAG: nuclear transport factor 2 family protein [Candidatus Binatia bacterium]
MAAMTLQEIAARMEIDDLLTRYATAIDTRDWDLYACCFTPDAFIDYTAAGGIKGRLPEVQQWLAEVMALFPMTQHLVTNRTVVIQGAAATCRSYLFNPMGLPDGSGGLLLCFDGGCYRDKLVCTEDGWRITERVEETSYSTRRHRLMGAPGTKKG